MAKKFSPSKNRSTTPPRWQAYAFLLLNAALWGAAFVIVKPAFEVTTPFRFLFYRHLVAATLTTPLLWHYRRQLTKIGRTIWTIIGLELLGSTLALSLLYIGLKYTSALEANLLGTTLPIFITLGGVFILKEKQERHEWLGLFIALAATFYLTVWPLLTTGSVDGISVIGNALIIASNIANLVYFPLAKRAYSKLPKFLVTTISFWIATISFFGLSLFETSGNVSSLLASVQLDFTASSVWFATLYMAIFGSIIGLTAYIKGQDGIEASEASFFYYLQPLVYLPLTFFVLKESITFGQLAALFVILTGVVIAERRPARLNHALKRSSKK